jgi:exodeoxyribonuclease VII large subunit
VSDRRAPTPTAAAELAVPVRLELLAQNRDFGARMTHAMGLRVTQNRQRLRDLGRALPRLETLLEAPRQRLDVMGGRLPAALSRLVDRQRLRLSEASGSLRPSVLRRALASDQRRLKDLGSRLGPRAITREITEGREALNRLAVRLKDVEAARIAEERRKLDALGRLCETLSYRATLERGYAVVRGDGGVVTRKAQAESATGLEIEFADGTLKLGGGAAKKASLKPGARKTDEKPEQGSLF